MVVIIPVYAKGEFNASTSMAGLASRIFVDIGIGFRPFVLGFITPLIGFRGMYLLLAALFAASVTFYHLLVGRHQKNGWSKVEGVPVE